MIQPKQLTCDAFDEQVIQCTVLGEYNRFSADITVGDIRCLFNEGLNNERLIRRAYPEIRPRTIALGRAFLMSADPGYYRDFVSSNPGPYRTLLDENIAPADVSTGAWSILGPTMHAHHVGLVGCGDSGTGDKPILAYMINHGVDAGLTLDLKATDDEMDLIALAMRNAESILETLGEKQVEVVDLEQLPVLIAFRIRSDGNRSMEVLRLLNKHKASVLSYLDTRTSPCIVVSEGNVRPVKTYTEIYARMMLAKHKDADVITRREKWVEQWMDRILKGASNLRNMSYKDFRALEVKVRAAAAICEPVQPQNGRRHLDFEDDLNEGGAHCAM